MTIHRSDLRTTTIVNTVCKLYDETGDITKAMAILAKYVSISVMDRVLLHPELRRQR
jgi:hypothetical protein